MPNHIRNVKHRVSTRGTDEYRFESGWETGLHFVRVFWDESIRWLSLIGDEIRDKNVKDQRFANC